MRALLAAASIALAGASALWDFVHAPNPHYNYVDTGVTIGDATWTVRVHEFVLVVE